MNVNENELVFKNGQMETTIKIEKDGDKLVFPLFIYDKTYNKDFGLLFSTFEDAYLFVQNVVNNSLYIGDVINKYKEMLNNYKENNKKFLSEIEVLASISNHFCNSSRYKAIPNKELSLEDDEVKVRFYIDEEYNYWGKRSNYKAYLSNECILSYINDYLKKDNLEAISFNCIGGINYDNNKPYFEGIEVITRDLNNTKGMPILKKNFNC